MSNPHKVFTDLLRLGYDSYSLEDTSPSPGQAQVICELTRAGDKFPSLTASASTWKGRKNL